MIYDSSLGKTTRLKGTLFWKITRVLFKVENNNKKRLKCLMECGSREGK